MKTCLKCHKTFDDSMAYCPYCGVELKLANVCLKCGKEVPEDADFCPFCAANLKPQKEAPKKESKLTEEQIKKYEVQLQRMRASKTRFSVAGAICLSFSIFAIILGIVLIVVNVPKEVVGAIVFGSVVLALGAILLPLGIIFLVLASALYSRRINNRERLLKSYK